MARPRPPDRLEHLAASAVKVFTARGYRRAQMADVAREMGVAPGTLYLYVESKEALFDLAVRYSLANGEGELPNSLPIPTPAPGTLAAHVRARLARATALPSLAAALSGDSPPDARAEFLAILGELYDAAAHFRQARNLLVATALDWPELPAIWYDDVRRGLNRRLIQYLERRIEQQLLRELPDVAAGARLIGETVAWFARNRYRDPSASAIDDDTARRTVLHVLTHAFCPDVPTGDKETP
jgi:AcrR family transcriptional regulator